MAALNPMVRTVDYSELIRDRFDRVDGYISVAKRVRGIHTFTQPQLDALHICLAFIRNIVKREITPFIAATLSETQDEASRAPLERLKSRLKPLTKEIQELHESVCKRDNKTQILALTVILDSLMETPSARLSKKEALEVIDPSEEYDPEDSLNLDLINTIKLRLNLTVDRDSLLDKEIVRSVFNELIGNLKREFPEGTDFSASFKALESEASYSSSPVQELILNNCRANLQSLQHVKHLLDASSSFEVLVPSSDFAPASFIQEIIGRHGTREASKRLLDDFCKKIETQDRVLLGDVPVPLCCVLPAGTTAAAARQLQAIFPKHLLAWNELQFIHMPSLRRALDEQIMLAQEQLTRQNSNAASAAAGPSFEDMVNKINRLLAERFSHSAAASAVAPTMPSAAAHSPIEPARPVGESITASTIDDLQMLRDAVVAVRAAGEAVACVAVNDIFRSLPESVQNAIDRSIAFFAGRPEGDSRYGEDHRYDDEYDMDGIRLDSLPLIRAIDRVMTGL